MSKPTLSRREISARTKLPKPSKEDHQRVKDAHARFKNSAAFEGDAARAHTRGSYSAAHSPAGVGQARGH